MDNQEAMDAFATRTFDGAEIEAYGARNILAAPLRERNFAVDLMPLTGHQLTERTQQLTVARTTNAQLTTLRTDAKENADMSFEINVPTGTDVQVQIEVADSDGNLISRSPLKWLSLDHDGTSNAACIRLQRANALPTISSSIQHMESHSAQNYSANDRLTNSAAIASPVPVKKNESGKHLTWHASVMDAIESHEFRRTSKASTSTATATHQTNILKNAKTPNALTSSKNDVAIAKGLVAGRTAIFEHQNAFDDDNGADVSKDPAELSLADRLALFEKNKGTALIPKAALGMSPSAKQIANLNTSIPDSRGGIRLFPEPQIAHKSLQEHEMDILLNLLNYDKNYRANDTKRPTSPPPPPPKPKPNDGHMNTSQKRHSDEDLNVSHSVRDAIEDVKRVKINPPKIGSIYPSLSDTEDDVQHVKNETSANDSIYPSLLDISSDAKPKSSESSESTEIYETPQTSTKREDNDDLLFSSRPPNGDNDENDGLSTHTTESETQSSDGGYTGIEDYLDEALESDEDVDYSSNPLDKEDLDAGASISSSSFRFGRPRLEALREQARKEVMQLNLPVKQTHSNNTETLAHTVDSYRLQQLEIATPVLRKVVRGNDNKIDTGSDTSSDDGNRAHDDHVRSQAEVVDAKIQKLLEIAAIQQQQMIQASNALNTCASTFAFSGSTESVVAEWKLLIATHSRLAAQTEVNRLRTDRFLRAANARLECGRLIIKEITLPLQQEYVSKFQNDQIRGQHLVCLLKYNEQVVATKTMPTQPASLSAKFHDTLQLNNVYADFRVTMEIYGMEAQHEVLPHDVKYRIKKKKGLLRTPIGKKSKSRVIMPPMQLPSGPNSVRTPSFKRYASVKFSLRDAHRTNWTLDLVPAVSNPLFGNVYMKMNYEFAVNIDHKGFLTMFEDVSGFGAWHRRWCRLHSTTCNTVLLSYWKYPDDERKPPIGNLDLSACEQKMITMAPRDVCARLNTMLLELKRPRREDDQDSLTLVRNGDHTIVRHLLAADTKEERNEWIAHFTKALALMRSWSVQR